MITVEHGKGDKVRAVPLTPAAEAILDRQPRFIGKPWMFCEGKGERVKEVSSRIGGLMRRIACKAAQDGTEFQLFSHHDSGSCSPSNTCGAGEARSTTCRGSSATTASRPRSEAAYQYPGFLPFRGTSAGWVRET
jgi:hypothetical protein